MRGECKYLFARIVYSFRSAAVIPGGRKLVTARAYITQQGCVHMKLWSSLLAKAVQFHKFVGVKHFRKAGAVAEEGLFAASRRQSARQTPRSMLVV